jgi:putative two-component system response regulator
VSPPLVLIVDDNPENLSVVGELLLPRHAVRVANSGLRALEMARLAPQPDLILLDVMMPGMDGFEVLRTLRSQPETAAIPVVLLTALDSADEEERGLRLGAADYLTKPVRPGVLLARVAAQLARHNAARRQHAALLALQADVQRLQGDLDTALGVTLQTLLHLQDARDPGAALHRQRTQAYLHSLCQVLRRHPRFAAQLDDRQIGLLLRAAPLHDIGLLAVPDRVLDKPGPLDAAERQLVQGHAQAGAELLARMLAPPAGTAAPAAPGSWLHWAQQIALGHHERWDGQGYPQGLAGDAIDWPVRLMAVVDTYDALTARRPHRQALAHADAAAVVAAGRGQQFDPDVTDAFLEVCDDWPAMGLRHV